MDSISSWFTPTVLFCFLNLIIISIFINAFYSTKSHKNQLAQHDSPPQLNRSSSSLLARVKSINFSMKRFDPFQPQTNYEIHETQEAIAPEKRLSEPVKAQEKKEQLTTITTEQEVAPEKKLSVSEEVPVKTQEKTEQLTNTTSSVKERKKNKLTSAGRGEAADEQVDAKADDFINRFKQQLKMQRIESIKRYTQMLTGGASSTN